jgi:PRTRC genetic system protein A
MNPVGYLHNARQGLKGERGIGYQYVMAANGLFLQAESPQLKATVLVAEVLVRGLAPLQEGIELPLGKIPMKLWESALRIFQQALPQERLLTIGNLGQRPGLYLTHLPEQETTSTSVRYRPLYSQLLEVHSHGRLRAFFSGTDDADEQGFKIYGCVGLFEGRQEWKLRVGIYGHFAPLELDQVFA